MLIGRPTTGRLRTTPHASPDLAKSCPGPPTGAWGPPAASAPSSAFAPPPRGVPDVLARLRVVTTVGQGRPWPVHLLVRIYATGRAARNTNPLPSTQATQRTQEGPFRYSPAS